MTITVRAQADNTAEILVYDVIGADFFGEGVTAAGVKKELEALGDVTDINVRINSPGGNVWDGIAIFNLLKQHKAQVHVQVDGIAASAASLIAMAGDLITMGEGSMMMIHNPWTLAIGSADELRKAADMVEKVEGQFVGIYSNRSGMKAERVGELMDAETWFTAAEAVESGFADDQTKADKETDTNARADSWNRVLATFKKAPQQFSVGSRGPEVLAPRIAASVVPNQSGVPDATPQKEASMSDQAPASVQAADIQKAADQAAANAIAAETNRRAGIRGAFSPFASQYRDLMDQCMDDPKCSVEAAREKLLAKLGEGQVPVGEGAVIAGADARDKFKVGAERALLAKAGLEKRDDTNEFQGQTLWQLAGHALERAGVSIRGLSADGIARKVFAVHTSSDFPQLLSNTAGKVLRAAYGNFPNTWQQIAATGSVSDFKIHPRIQMGSFNNLATIPEGSEYTYGSLAEQYENAQAVTKGKAIALTRQMIVNDDLGGFTRRAQIMGRAAARTVNTDFYAYLTSGSSNLGPTSTDGGQFFNATATTTAGGHANLLASGSGTAISTASIAVGRAAMRKQKDASNRETLNITPKVLLTGVGKEDVAWAVLNSVTDVSSSNANKKNYAYDVARLDLVTDPYLDDLFGGLAWYLFADPMDAAAAFEVVFLDGQQTPFIDDMVDFDTDSMKFKVRLDYGVAIGDWRGAYHNDGA